MVKSRDYNGSAPLLNGYLSDHESPEKVVSIAVEPFPVYVEDWRDSNRLNFDFTLTGLTDKRLVIRFIKAAVYDEQDKLVTFRHLNHNAVGVSGIQTIGNTEIDGRETIDLFNPFHSFPKNVLLYKLRYMFTFRDPETGKEYYYGNTIIHPTVYHQKVELTLPVKGLITILDGHDYYSHHRRFAMNLVRNITNNTFWSNFSRYSVDLTLLGEDGNTRKMTPEEYPSNYDFHFTDITKFYTHEATVYAPADGEIVEIVDDLDDLYDTRFDFDQAIADNRVKDLAGNYIIIKHNESEYSHLFHLLKDGIDVSVGDHVSKGERIAKIGFSGASTTYSHLHYQLLDGVDFLKANPLPCRFSNVSLLNGKQAIRYEKACIDTGDILFQE
ncbi:MAG: M23 family metallopeptidase [Candidatus Bathyarchaeota archaeon]|nr:M23 family metallopeptidase [Candidatus Bathyarchaeota archaeon]